MAPKAVSSTTPALTTKQAATAIIGLINARPVSPRQDEIEAIVARAVAGCVSASAMLPSDLQARLLEAVHEHDASGNALREAPDEGYELADARYRAALDRVNELAVELPTPARSITDIVLRAHVARCNADKAYGGGLEGLSDEAEADQATAARLIEAILQFAGIKHN